MLPKIYKVALRLQGANETLEVRKYLKYDCVEEQKKVDKLKKCIQKYQTN